MIGIIRKCLDMFTMRERIKLLLLVLALCGMAFVNMLGVASVVPLLMVMTDPSIIQTNDQFHYIYELFGFDSQTKFIIFTVLAVISLNLLTIGLRSVTQYFTIRFNTMRSFDIAQRVLKGYLSKPFDWFLGRHSADIAKTLLQETRQLLKQAISPIVNMAQQILIIAFLLAFLVFIDWRAALGSSLILGIAYTGVFVLTRGPLQRAGARQLYFNRKRFRTTHEVLGGLKEAKILGIEQGALNRFSQSARAFAHQTARTGTIRNASQQSLEAIAFTTMMSVLLWLYLANENRIEAILPVLGGFAAASMRLLPAVKALFGTFAQLRTGLPLLDRLHAEYMDLMQSTTRFPAVTPLPLQERVELRDVVYTYPGAKEPTLRGLTLEITARTTVGVVGGTGAGKTSMLDVILGLLEPASGALVIDGQPLDTAILRRRWQRSIGYVPQQIYITADTVAANIAFGVSHQKIDQDAVERAARLAQIHDFIMNEMPDGYASVVGERGVKLSGGQRQRLGIARALYRNPEILVLDEATSALDVVTERAFMRAVEALGGQKTIIMVAHRLSTVRDCDKIFLLQAGRMIASGTFDELVNCNENFREMARGAA